MNPPHLRPIVVPSVLPRLLTLVCAVLLGTPGEAAVARVVSQTVGTDELLLAVAEPAEVAALSHLARQREYSAVAEQAQAFPQLALQADAEQVLAHRPTLVLLADYSRAELREQLLRARVPVWVMSRYATLEDSFANLRELGRRLGPAAEARAEQVIAETTARLGALQLRLADARPVRVLAPSTYSILAGRDTTFADLCAHAKADNLADSLGGLVGHAPQPTEAMLAWPIERLVLSGQDPEATLHALTQIPPYRYLAAVREHRFVQIEEWHLSCVSHHRVAAYEALARALHPECWP